MMERMFKNHLRIISAPNCKFIYLELALCHQGCQNLSRAQWPDLAELLTESADAICTEASTKVQLDSAIYI